MYKLNMRNAFFSCIKDTLFVIPYFFDILFFSYPVNIGKNSCVNISRTDSEMNPIINTLVYKVDICWLDEVRTFLSEVLHIFIHPSSCTCCSLLKFCPETLIFWFKDDVNNFFFFER